MDCWICSKHGKTGEHLLKASDLRFFFGDITQQTPVFLHKEGRSLKVQSANSKHFKSDAYICNTCNSALTQPHDHAWADLSAYLQKNVGTLKKTKRLKLSKPFPGSTHKAALNIHLYFAKLFGCRVVSDSVPIDIKPFSQSILNGTPHPDLYISFGTWGTNGRSAGITDINAIKAKEEHALVYWFYVVGKIAVYVAYCPMTHIRKLTKNCWHPSSVTKQVSFEEYDT